MRSCGGCTLCCKLMAVSEIEKPAGVWCRHCDVGEGCRVYQQRPASCRAFVCMWVLSQEWDDLRPDKSGVLLFHPQGSPGRIQAHCDPHRPEAWNRGDMGKLLAAIRGKRIEVLLIVGDRHKLLSNDGASAIARAVFGPSGRPA